MRREKLLDERNIIRKDFLKRMKKLIKQSIYNGIGILKKLLI
jgi:hypothetical protein